MSSNLGKIECIVCFYLLNQLECYFENQIDNIMLSNRTGTLPTLNSTTKHDLCFKNQFSSQILRTPVNDNSLWKSIETRSYILDHPRSLTLNYKDLADQSELYARLYLVSVYSKPLRMILNDMAIPVDGSLHMKESKETHDLNLRLSQLNQKVKEIGLKSTAGPSKQDAATVQKLKQVDSHETTLSNHTKTLKNLESKISALTHTYEEHMSRLRNEFNASQRSSLEMTTSLKTVKNDVSLIKSNLDTSLSKVSLLQTPDLNKPSQSNEITSPATVNSSNTLSPPPSPQTVRTKTIQSQHASRPSESYSNNSIQTRDMFEPEDDDSDSLEASPRDDSNLPEDLSPGQHDDTKQYNHILDDGESLASSSLKAQKPTDRTSPSKSNCDTWLNYLDEKSDNFKYLKKVPKDSTQLSDAMYKKYISDHKNSKEFKKAILSALDKDIKHRLKQRRSVKT